MTLTQLLRGQVNVVNSVRKFTRQFPTTGVPPTPRKSSHSREDEGTDSILCCVSTSLTCGGQREVQNIFVLEFVVWDRIGEGGGVRLFR